MYSLIIITVNGSAALLRVNILVFSVNWTALTQELHRVIYCNARNIHTETCIGINNNSACQQIQICSWGRSVVPLDLTGAQNWALLSCTVGGKLVRANILQTVRIAKVPLTVGLKLLKCTTQIWNCAVTCIKWQIQRLKTSNYIF